jgi:hypothetical protein
LPAEDHFRRLTMPYLALVNQISIVATVNRVLGTNYSPATIDELPSEVIEACLAMQAMQSENTR